MTAQILPFPKLTPGGFGFSLKSRKSTKTVENDEDWYIPYNGPYEEPRELRNRRRARDSWGDLVEPDDDNEVTVLSDKELHLRYGGHNDLVDRNEEERKGRSRDRTFSLISGHTVSSGTVDPSRPNMNTNRRVSGGTRQILSSYISLDAVGGVGESPVPPRRNSKGGNRMSLAGMFNFGSQSRKPSPPTAALPAEHVVSGSFVRKPSLLQSSNIRIGGDKERVSRKIASPVRYGSSPEHHANPPMKDKHQQLHHRVTLQGGRPSSDAVEDDYYSSYYSTLIHEQSEPAPNHRHQHQHSASPSEDLHHSQPPSFDQSSLNRHNSSSTSSGHPYALAIPRNNVEEFSTVPPIPPTNLPRLTFTSPSHKFSTVGSSNFTPTRIASARALKLKNSNSTPDIRKSAVLRDPVVNIVIPITNSTPQQIETPLFPKAKDRWLSAETWCDALLFPRPRLKVGNVSTNGGSRRIVSPPESPLELAGAQEPGVPSRVLAHSRSLVDLHRPTRSSYKYPIVPTSVSHGQDPQTLRAGAQSRPPRPTSFAQDDLALLIPVPSLAHVLEQGHQLADERKAWQLQAKGSFGNKRVRSLSRTRSKSLTQKGRRRGHQPQTSMEYLAAQACLGNQNLTPNLPVADFNNILFPDTTNASSSRKGSHSHDGSQVKSLSSKSSKSHSRGDSWSKSAVKVAKSTAAICGFPATKDEVGKAASLEGALKGDTTKVIRLADPADIPIDRDNTSSNNSTRLTPSLSNSDQRVGIALGTPPEDEQGDSFYLPCHPYAQGGLSFTVPSPSSNQRHIDRATGFAGPHRSIKSGVSIPYISDNLARHKLPPHLLLHPYAQGSSARDTYLEQNGLLAQYRSNDDTPQQNKMWAQLSPGVVREVLPGDIQYSPFIPDNDHHISPVSTSSSDPISDTIGLGETLVNTAPFHRHQDGSVNTNDPDTYAKPISQANWDRQSQNTFPEFGPRIIRNPTEHNVAAPSEDSEAPQQPPSLTNQIVSALPEERMVTDRADSASPAVTSTTSTSSPRVTAHHFSSPTDLESFQDLFYRPNNRLRPSPSEAAFPDTPSPPNVSAIAWDRNTRGCRTESGLTSLARQLSEEFELMALERERLSSQYSFKRSSSRQQSNNNISRQPTDGSLQFVFEETRQSESLPELDHHPAIHAFQPSSSLPEDVESSRASSLIERIETEDEDNTVMLRVGIIESILTTPSSVPPQHRPSSSIGETSCFATTTTTTHDNAHPHHQQQDQQPESPPPTSSEMSSGQVRTRPPITNLRPPSSEEVRSSFLTTSTVSRMSNLSDFPSPPKDHHHRSMTLSTYFSDADLGQNVELQIQDPSTPRLQQQQPPLFFRKNQDAGDLAETLPS